VQTVTTLASLTNEQFHRLMAIMALTHADELRELSPVRADEVLAAAREATGLTDKALRSVTLPDGSAVLVGADPQHDQDVTPKPQ
jgi:hypothetical protein